MDSSELDALFARVAAGDPSAVEPAFAALCPVVRRYCQKLLLDSQDAEDATQASLIKMFEQASDYDPNRSALGWALAFAYWECRTERARRARRSSREVAWDRHEPQSGARDPEEVVSTEQLTEIASQLIASLAPDDRALLGEHEAGLSDSLAHLGPAARRKRKQRVLARLRSAFMEIVRPGTSARGTRS